MVFSAFAEMIRGLPPEAIINGLDLECRELENDFETGCLDPDEDALSILCFKQFIQMVRKGQVLRCAKHLPSEHLDFYRETIARLVQANELRAAALEYFEEAFGGS